jgi:hypothetical protein
LSEKGFLIAPGVGHWPVEAVLDGPDGEPCGSGELADAHLAAVPDDEFLRFVDGTTQWYIRVVASESFLEFEGCLFAVFFGEVVEDLVAEHMLSRGLGVWIMSPYTFFLILASVWQNVTF